MGNNLTVRTERGSRVKADSHQAVMYSYTNNDFRSERPAIRVDGRRRLADQLGLFVDCWDIRIAGLNRT